jgi:hypothetical protein
LGDAYDELDVFFVFGFAFKKVSEPKSLGLVQQDNQQEHRPRKKLY